MRNLLHFCLSHSLHVGGSGGFGFTFINKRVESFPEKKTKKNFQFAINYSSCDILAERMLEPSRPKSSPGCGLRPRLTEAMGRPRFSFSSARAGRLLREGFGAAILI